MLHRALRALIVQPVRARPSTFRSTNPLARITPSITITTLNAFRTLATMSDKTLAVCDASELKDGQMKQVDFDEGKVLLSKLGGKVYATSAHCTHYGAPLAKGVLDSSGRVVCPWHGACFNVKVGDVEDGPGLDALYSYTAEERDGKIFVTAPLAEIKSKVGRSPLKASKAVARATNTSQRTDETTVIVGGGAGAIHCLESLREHGYPGKIVVLSRDENPPYDRTKLSKGLVTDASKVLWRKKDELENDFKIDLHLGASVTKVDSSKQTVSTDGKGEFKYDYLVLAPGSAPKRLPIEGADLKGVETLRGIDDVQRIVAGINKEAKIAIIGTSFIGMELAQSIVGKEPASVDVIGVDPIPFAAILGEDIGKAIQKSIADKGVKFHMEANVEKIVPSKTDSSKVGAVKLKGQDDIECDMLIMGVGVAPDTKFLADSGFDLEKDKGISVDENLRVSGHKNIFAVGDIAHYPQNQGPSRRVEHWNVGANHGRSVGETIATQQGKAFTKVPIFWSSVGGGLRYVGTGSGQDDIYVDGDLAKELKFVSYYAKQDGTITAVASVKSDPYVAKAAELIRLGKMPKLAEIKAGKDIVNDIDIGGKIGN